MRLTQHESTYWSMATGDSEVDRPRAPPFTILDPGRPPGRPDPDHACRRILRGSIVLWAVDANVYPIGWNHLTGSAVILDYERGDAWEYAPPTFRCLGAEQGEECGSSEEAVNISSGEYALPLDGLAYDHAPGELLLEFYAAGADPFGLLPPIGSFAVDTVLTLLPLMMDFRWKGDGPTTTTARFDIWNMNEVRFSGTERCITCWDDTLLSRFEVLNHFLLPNLQTDKGRARIDGIQSSTCPGSIDTPLLGVAAQRLRYPNGTSSHAGSTLAGLGFEQAIIWDEYRGAVPRNDNGQAPTDGRKHVARDVRTAESETDRPRAALEPEYPQAGTGRQGSLLVFPNVEVKWDASGKLAQDTNVELSNDYPADVYVRLYLVAADDTCVWESGTVLLTPYEPAYWSVRTGAPKGAVSYSSLAGLEVPDDDPANPGGTRLRGYLVAWAVNDEELGQEIHWNHLSGRATFVNYSSEESWEYMPYAFRALDQGGSVGHGDQTGTPKVLHLNGIEFD